MGQQTKESSLLSLILGTQQIKLAVLSQELGLFVRMESDSHRRPQHIQGVRLINKPYSTVTLLAKFRGKSMGQPLCLAV